MRILIAALCFAAASVAHAGDFSTYIGKPYAELREKLVADHWSPVAREPDDTCATSSINLCGIYPEAKDCAGTGAAPCSLFWSKNGEILHVGTAGNASETTPVVAGFADE